MDLTSTQEFKKQKVQDIAKNKSKIMSSGHALASECVCQTQELSVLKNGKLLTSECVCQTRELRLQNQLLYGI